MIKLTLTAFNDLTQEQALEHLQHCCGASKWSQLMSNARPFVSLEQLHDAAASIWNSLSTDDWLEAFEHHPQIGDLDSLRKKFASTKTWAAQEQGGTSEATDEVLEELALLNQDYLNKFGFIFIICATGKSAQEMLNALKIRMNHKHREELSIAAAEQQKITAIRLNKLLA